MNTTRDSRCSFAFHSRCTSPSSIMCTPWKTKRLGSFGNATIPLQRKMFGPSRWVSSDSQGMNFSGSTSPGCRTEIDCISAS